jgi:hypothetical protein
MLGRKVKRYTVRRSGDGYEVCDGDTAGTRVYFSDSRKSAREMSRHLNDTQRTEDRPTNIWGDGLSP